MSFAYALQEAVEESKFQKVDKNAPGYAHTRRGLVRHELIKILIGDRKIRWNTLTNISKSYNLPLKDLKHGAELLAKLGDVELDGDRIRLTKRGMAEFGVGLTGRLLTKQHLSMPRHFRKNEEYEGSLDDLFVEAAGEREPLDEASRKMTPKQAYQELKKTRTISTAMLKPLGVSMDQFLQLGQLPKAKHDEIIDKYLKHLEQKFGK